MTKPLRTATLTGMDHNHLAEPFRAGQVRSVQALSSSNTAHLCWMLWETLRQPVVLITDGPNSQDELFEDLKSLGLGREDLLGYYPAWESMPSSEQPPQADLVGDRLATLRRFLSAEPPAITVTTIQAIMQHTIAASALRESTDVLTVNSDMDLEATLERLVAAGFDMQPEVFAKGQAARRGGLLDLWPTTEDWPVRIELFGSTIESIRTFDPNDQRSLDHLSTLHISPAVESIADGTFFDYLPSGMGWVVADPGLVEHHAMVYEETIAEADAMHLILPHHQCKKTMRRVGVGQLLVGPDDPDPDQHWELNLNEITGVSTTAASVFTPDALEQARDHFITTLKNQLDQGFDISLFFGTNGIRDRFIESRNHDTEFLESVSLHLGRLSAGFVDTERRLIAVAESDLFGQRKALRGRYHLHARRKGPAQQSVGQRIEEWTELRAGEYVVHVDHGIGKYLGLAQVTIRGQRQEAVTIEYANNAKLHVPVTHVHLLSRYVGTGQRSPTLHRLGSRRWNREKQAASKSIEDLAASMLETQATRDTEQGFACAADTTCSMNLKGRSPSRKRLTRKRPSAKSSKTWSARVHGPAYLRGCRLWENGTGHAGCIQSCDEWKTSRDAGTHNDPGSTAS